MKKLVAVLLFALAVPAVAAPLTLRSEVPVSAPAYGVAPNITRANAQIATNGDQYLAVWTDYREANVPAVYAARLRADGSVIDPFGIRVAADAFAGPIVWTGTKYLLTYENPRTYDSYIRSMTIDGVFGEPMPIGKSVLGGSMGANGTNVLLVLPASAMLLDLEGNKLRDVTLAPTPNGYYYTRIAAAGSTYLVAAALPGIMVQTVSSDGTVGAPRTLFEPATHTTIDVASDGERFLLVYPIGYMYAQVLSKAGVPEGPAQALGPLGNTNYPSVEWRGVEYLLVYHDRNDYTHIVQRVAWNGVPVGDFKRLPHDYNSDVDIASQGRSGIALYGGQITAGVFDDASLSSDEIFRRQVAVAVTAPPQQNVRIARIGDGTVTAWTEGGHIMLSRGAGTTPVAVAGSSFSLMDVLVDRSNIIWVLWQGSAFPSVGISRFFADLTPVDPAPIYVETPCCLALDAAAAGDGVIALAYHYGEVDAFTNVGALLLWETGNGIARKDVQLTGQEFADYGPTVAFDGSAFVYAWSHAKSADTGHSGDPLPEIELVGARVSPAGQLLDANPVHIADDIGVVTHLDSAAGANGVAFAWQSDGRTTRAALFNGTSIDLGGSATRLAELAPHNGGFLLVRGTVRPSPELSDIDYVLLGSNLTVTGSASLPPFETTQYVRGIDIDVVGGDQPVFVYARVANEGVYGHVLRVFERKTGAATRRRVVR